MKNKPAALALAIGMLAWSWTTAQAHALLVRSNPEANATLATAPRFVELVFSEALEPAFSTASLLNASGLRLDNNDTNVDSANPTRLTFTLRPLPDGVYTVTWKALSAVDGHGTTGAFAFAVGTGSAQPPSTAPPNVETNLPVAEVIARWLMYLGAAIMTGGAVFLLAVWMPAVRLWMQEGETSPLAALPWPTLARFGAGVFLLANLLGLWAQGSQAAGGTLRAPWDPALATVLFTTRFGTLWSARLLLGLGLAAMLPRVRSTFGHVAALVLAAALLLDVSLGSHAATEARAALPVFGDWLHLVAASIWVGGLACFVAGLLAIRRVPDRPRTKLVADLIPRFSRLALPTVVFLVGSGTYAAVLRVGTWPGLFGTAYGQTLLAKILVALSMVSFGAVNLLVITHRMRRGATLAEGAPRLVGVFRRLVTAEVVLGCTALLAAGLLTSEEPPRAPTVPESLTVQGTADDLRVVLEISPGRVGANAFAVTLKSGGHPIVGAKEVQLRFTPGSIDVPPMEAVLVELGDGRYGGRGTYLSLPDRWQVQVAVRREGTFDSFADLTVDLRPSEAAQNPPWARMTGALLAAAGVLAWAAIQRRRGGLRARILGAIPAVALSAAGLAVLSRPLPTRNFINPVPPSSASVAAGRSLYEKNCVICHGPGGKGDGPLGLTLNPRPADLTLHSIPGVHPDGQLYDWITNGYRGSIMPAWKDRLSETLRWDIVNYLRTLAPRTQP